MLLDRSPAKVFQSCNNFPHPVGIRCPFIEVPFSFPKLADMHCHLTYKFQITHYLWSAGIRDNMAKHGENGRKRIKEDQPDTQK
jgi:hypothetical protein